MGNSKATKSKKSTAPVKTAKRTKNKELTDKDLDRVSGGAGGGGGDLPMESFQWGVGRGTKI